MACIAFVSLTPYDNRLTLLSTAYTCAALTLPIIAFLFCHALRVGADTSCTVKVRAGRTL
jgi:hypothetical protein